jgi:hypothetical protein
VLKNLNAKLLLAYEQDADVRWYFDVALKSNGKLPCLSKMDARVPLDPGALFASWNRFNEKANEGDFTDEMKNDIKRGLRAKGNRSQAEVDARWKLIAAQRLDAVSKARIEADKLWPSVVASPQYQTYARGQAVFDEHIRPLLNEYLLCDQNVGFERNRNGASFEEVVAQYGIVEVICERLHIEVTLTDRLMIFFFFFFFFFLQSFSLVLRI